MKKVLAFTVAVSLLFLGVPAPTNAGVVAGVATEWTQILNHVQLVMNYIRMGVQLQIEMQQLSEQLKQGKGLPSQIFGSIQQDLGQLAQIVQGGQALAYSMREGSLSERMHLAMRSTASAPLAQARSICAASMM